MEVCSQDSIKDTLWARITVIALWPYHTKHSSTFYDLIKEIFVSKDKHPKMLMIYLNLIFRFFIVVYYVSRYLQIGFDELGHNKNFSLNSIKCIIYYTSISVFIHTLSAWVVVRVSMTENIDVSVISCIMDIQPNSIVSIQLHRITKNTRKKTLLLTFKHT